MKRWLKLGLIAIGVILIVTLSAIGWFLSNALPLGTGGIDSSKLQKALDMAFAEPGPAKPQKTRAIIVVYDGRMVAERYAGGFNQDMPLLGWSMSKSVTSALVGIQVKNRWWQNPTPNGIIPAARQILSPALSGRRLKKTTRSTIALCATNYFTK
jgi:hypothetical protein